MKRILSAFLAVVMILSVVPLWTSAEETAIIDESFESGNGIFGQRGTVTLVNSDKAAYSGKKSLLLDGRGTDAWNGPSASVVGKVRLDEVYYLRMYVRAAAPGDSFHVKFIFELSDDTGKTYPNVVNGLVSYDEWTLIEGYWTAEYTGSLGDLNLCVETEENGIGKSFYIDDVFFAQADVTPSEPQQSEEAADEGSAAAVAPYTGKVVPTGVYGTEYEAYYNFLAAFDIVSHKAEDVVDIEAGMTKGEFMEYVYKIHSQCSYIPKAEQIFHDVPADHPHAAAIAYGYNNGIISGDGSGFFEPDTLITYETATIILMKVLGYGAEEAMSPASAKVAGVLDNVTTGGSLNNVTYGNLYTLLYNTLHAKIVKRFVYATNISGYSYDDKTFLEEYYKVKQLNGVVKANCFTSLDSGTHTSVGYIRINNVIFKEVGVSAEKLIGRYVTAYYKSDDNEIESELLYIEPVASKNRTFVITDEEFMGYDNFEYSYLTESYDVKTKEIAHDFILIYNHRAIKPGDTFDINMMMPQVGTITLLANDGSTNYSIVIVEDYETLVVSGIDKTTYKVYDKLSGTSLVLDAEKGDSFIDIVDEKGANVDMSTFKENDVITYLKSSGTYHPVISGYKTKKKVTGVVTSVANNDDEIIVGVGDKEYELSPHYIEAGFDAPLLSEKITAYLDVYGKIAYIDDSTLQGITTAYLFNAATDDTIDKRVEVKLFMSDGEFKCYKLADKVKLRNTQYANSDILRELTLGGINGKAKQQIIAFSTNAEGYINRIDFPHSSEQAAITARDGNSFHRIVGTEDKNSDGSNKFTFKNTIGVFYKLGYGFFAVNDRTTIFAVPEPGSADCYDEDSFSIVKVSSLSNNSSHTIDPFVMGYDSVPATCAVKYDAAVAEITSREVYILTKFTQALDDEGMDTVAIRVFKDNAEQKYMLKSTDVWQEAAANNGGTALKSGDIVRFETNTKGRVIKLEKSTVINSYDEEFAGMEGYIFRKTGSWAYFTATKPTADTQLNGDMILVPLDQFAITVYSVEGKTARAGTSADIRDYETVGDNCSKVYMTLNYENPISLIAIEK